MGRSLVLSVRVLHRAMHCLTDVVRLRYAPVPSDRVRRRFEDVAIRI